VNQAINLIQWKNLTEEQQADFDFENYKYEGQYGGGDTTFQEMPNNIRPSAQGVYRLNIEPDKWYFIRQGDFLRDLLNLNKGLCILGKDLLNHKDVLVSDLDEIRPARLDEIPKQETLEDRIKAEWPDKEVVMLEPQGFGNLLSVAIPESINNGTYKPHFYAQSMKGFARYVYQRPDESGFFIRESPVWGWNDNIILQPVAVLFDKEVN
jgi:hypothetical protein